MRSRSALVLTASLIALMASPALSQDAVAHPDRWPTSHSPAALTGPVTEARVRDLLAAMTLEEKVGQLIQADIGSIKPEDLGTYPIGSILAGGSSSPNGDERSGPQAWLDLSRAFREAAAARPGARVPLLFGVDAVHGHANIVGATIFPHNIGLGAARDPELVGAIARATAEEVAATGVDWTFAPTLAVPRDDRWGRTYEGFSEDPAIARDYAAALVHGLQGDLRDGHGLAPGHVMGSAKHFLADGGTTDGRDRGDAAVSEEDLIDVHLSGYREAIDAGVLSIMVSFSSWNGAKHTGNRSLLTDVLRGPLGFEGLLIGDWDAHAALPGCRSDSCPDAIKAGLDMFMAPNAWKALYDNTLAQARSGEISAARLDEAVARILRAKIAAGVFDPADPIEGRFEVIGSPDHRALARRAVRQSLVLLKNENATLPIRPGARVLVVGEAADDIGMAAGGWTIGWQGVGNTNADFPGGTSIWAGLRDAVAETGGEAILSPDGVYETKPDVAVVVFGETPYAEFYGDQETLDFSPSGPLETLRRLKAAGVPTVAVFLSGRPLWTNPEINAADAFVAAWLPGSEGAGIADVLVAGADGAPRHEFTGTLSFSWPRSAAQPPQNVGAPGYDPQFAFGYGLTYARHGSVARLSEQPGLPDDATPLPRFFASGRFVAPWSLTLRDGGGNVRVESPGGASSPSGGVVMAPIDGLAQESARRFRFTTAGASAAVGGPPTAVDPTLALSLRYRADAPVALSIGRATVTLDRAIDWTTAVVPLGCFREADPARISQIQIAAPAGSEVAIEDLGLGTFGMVACPAL
ncbi:glycoside hydrolase family 3 N-terminal domain-containing protein [Brevundimonas sp. NIBR11]|uniref:glycoside hydrolase family 3 protein n=1 Tax=Brevundimonas sp. NIBR11 TaxID=3015999 RepID=UPI0022F059E4|nr:glycoside hydrolase family 3 N-terminal domain-containing protein [Brevundimonas sp. NIBR11]WGM31926.1 Beta-hexosaminidase [Brevundimonas sp. NIBR11]